MSKQIIIISLGTLIKQNLQDALAAFAALIAEKKPSEDLSGVHATIGMVLHKSMNRINQMKLGEIDENEFTEDMINELETATGIKLTAEEFDSAWNAMNPTFADFADLLDQAVEYNRQPDQQIIFISFTNPKDMKHLTKELEANLCPYRELDEQLFEIGGISLYTTYSHKKTGPDLFQSIIADLKDVPSLPTALLANSMLGRKPARESKLPIIYYVTTELKNSFMVSAEGVNRTTAENLSIPIVEWNPRETELKDVLNANNSPITLCVG